MEGWLFFVVMMLYIGRDPSKKKRERGRIVEQASKAARASSASSLASVRLLTPLARVARDRYRRCLAKEASKSTAFRLQHK